MLTSHMLSHNLTGNNLSLVMLLRKYLVPASLLQRWWPAAGWMKGSDVRSASSHVGTWVSAFLRLCSATDTKTVPTEPMSAAVVSVYAVCKLEQAHCVDWPRDMNDKKINRNNKQEGFYFYVIISHDRSNVVFSPLKDSNRFLHRKTNF